MWLRRFEPNATWSSDDRSRQSGDIPVILDAQRGPSFEATSRREWIIDKDNIASTQKGAGSHCRYPSRGHPNPHERPPGPSAGTHPGYRSRRIAHASQLVDFGPHNDVDRVCLCVGERDRLFASLLDRLSDLGRYRGRWSLLATLWRTAGIRLPGIRSAHTNPTR